MVGRKRVKTLAVVIGMAASLTAGAAGAVEIGDMKGFEALFGRYAPGGDCAREPRVAVDATGIAVELKGATEKATRIEYAASYGGPEYQGSVQWFFPFRSASGYPVIMAFDPDAGTGLLTVEPHDEGWQGGPPLSARNAALVKGSPYARCGPAGRLSRNSGWRNRDSAVYLANGQA